MVVSEDMKAKELLNMKNTKTVKTLGLIGRILLVLGSALYVAELLGLETKQLTLAICVIYAVALILMLIEWIATRDERRAKKAAGKKAA